MASCGELVRCVEHRGGRRVPEDLALVGFDDFGLSRVTTPGISTVHVPTEQMARRATELLFARVDGSTTSPSQEVMESHFVARASCGC